MKIPINFRKPISSDMELERGQKQLNRLITIVDVLYALTLYKLFLLLPGLDLENLTTENLLQTLKESAG